MRGVNTMVGQLWNSRATRFWRNLILSSAVLFLLGSGVAWSADQANKMLSVAMNSAATNPTVTIKTAEPVGYRYTVYDSFEPTRVVVDFPGMEVSDIAETISVNKGGIKEIRAVGFDLSSGKLARVEIILAKTTEYQVNLDGKEFRIAFVAEGNASKAPVATSKAPTAANKKNEAAVKTAATENTNVLRSIKVSPGRAILQSSGNIGKYQYFALSNPPRLVLDIYGLHPAFKERSFSAVDGFNKIRVGTYNDKTRLVFDASGKTLPEHLVEGHKRDILISWGGDVKSASKVAAKVAPKPVAVKPVAKKSQAPKPAPVVAAKKPAAKASPAKATKPVAVESIDFISEEGRSVVAITLSGAAKISAPVVDKGNLVRFEIVNASITRALRRTIDASAFPSAVTSVTPYTVKDGDHQNVRIAVDLKGPSVYALEQDGNTVRLVVEDGAYAEPIAPAVSQVEVVAPKASQDTGNAGKQALLPSSIPHTADEMAAEAARYTGEKITLIFDSANVRSILQLIGDVSGLNILASGDVKGSVTLRLIDVPWDQALDLVLETASLGKVQEGNVLRIMPISRIRDMELASRKEQMVAIEEGVLETELFLVSYASVDDMKVFLTDIKSDRGSIIADSRNKQLIVRDVAEVLEQMKVMIGHIDKPERQVMIESRIVEASTNFLRNLGVKWNFDYAQDGITGDESFSVNEIASGMGGSFLLPVTNPALAGFSSLISVAALEDQINIDLRLSALETSGEGRVISTPRITTLNGEQASISQGTKIPFSTVSDAGTDVTFENAELRLDVTPEINPDGSILLEIDVSNSTVGSVVPTATGDAVSIDEKKATTKVLVRDGQTTVIGGIFIETERDASTGVPILMDIPWLGNLFKSTSKTRDRRELLIFITPRIVES